MPAFDDYVTLHNLSMPLTYIVTLTIYNGATRDVVIVSLYVDLKCHACDICQALPFSACNIEKQGGTGEEAIRNVVCLYY